MQTKTHRARRREIEKLEQEKKEKIKVAPDIRPFFAGYPAEKLIKS